MKKLNIDSLSNEFKEVREARKRYSIRLYEKSLQQISDENKVIFFRYPKYLENKFILSTKWLFNGFILHVGKVKLLVDPGAELLSRVPKIEHLLDINTLFISHAHIDHYAGANLAIELMTAPLKQKKITILASQDVIKRKVISDYHSGIEKGAGVIERIILKNGKSEILENITITPIALHHSIKDTYGFILKYKDIRIGYISDTGYTKTFITSTEEVYEAGIKEYNGTFTKIKTKFNYIKEHFANTDYLIVNVNDLLFTNHSRYHMTGFDLIDILSKSLVKKCFIINLHPVDLLNKDIAKKLAEYVTNKSGVPTNTISIEGQEFKLDI